MFSISIIRELPSHYAYIFSLTGVGEFGALTRLTAEATAAMERRRKLFRSRRKRSDSEERLYHGNAITLEQESQMTASGGAEAPVLGATTCGPLPGQLRAGAGAWGTINRETRPCLRDDGVRVGAGTAGEVRRSQAGDAEGDDLD